MTDDLISRNTLKQRIIKDYRKEFFGSVLWNILDDMPTVDAATVVHGRWNTSSDSPDTLICSVCGRKFDMYFFDSKDMPYCLCGAKMDGGAEG